MVPKTYSGISTFVLPMPIVFFLMVGSAIIARNSLYSQATFGYTQDTMQAYRYKAIGQAKSDSADFEGAARAYRQAAIAFLAAGDTVHHIDAISQQGTMLKKCYQYVPLRDLMLKLFEDHAGYLQVPSEHAFTSHALLGFAYEQLHVYTSALARYSQALEMGEKLWGPGHLKLAELYSIMGSVSLSMNQMKEALDWGHKYLATLTTHLPEGNAKIANAYTLLGTIYLYAGNLEEQYKYFSQALKTSQKNGGHQLTADFAFAHLGMGAYYFEKKNYVQAISFYKKSKDIYTRIQKKREYTERIALVNNNLANIYRYIDQNDLAIAHYQTSLNQIRALINEHNFREVVILGNLSICYARKEQFDLALNYAQEALRIGNQIKAPRDRLGEALGHVAHVYWHMKDAKKALEYFRKAFQKLGPDHRLRSEYLLGQARSLLELGKIAPAEKLLTQYHKMIARKYGVHHAKIAMGYTARSDLYKKTHQIDSALAMNALSLAINWPEYGQGEPDYIALASRDGVTILEDLKDKLELLRLKEGGKKEDPYLLQALQTSTHAIQVIQHLQTSFKSDQTWSELKEAYVQVYRQAVSIAFELYERNPEPAYLEQAFVFAEQNKASLLHTVLNAGKAKQLLGLPDSLMMKERQLTVQMDYYLKLLNEEQIKRERASPEKLKDFRQKVADARLGLQDFTESLQRTHPRFYQFKYTATQVDITAIQAQLAQKNKGLLSYFWTDTMLYIFSMHSGGLSGHKLALTNALKKDITTFISSLSAKTIADQYARAPKSIRAYAHHSHQLYRQLVPIVFRENEGYQASHHYS